MKDIYPFCVKTSWTTLNTRRAARSLFGDLKYKSTLNNAIVFAADLYDAPEVLHPLKKLSAMLQVALNEDYNDFNDIDFDEIASCLWTIFRRYDGRIKGKLKL